MRKFDPDEVRKALGEKVDANKLWNSMLSRGTSNEKSKQRVTFNDINDEKTMTPTSSINSDFSINSDEISV